MELKIGDRVEVTSEEEGFLGSYYSAKILAILVPTNELWIQYETLCTEQDESKLLRDIVHISDVRPYPPQIKCTSYSVLDEVDAFHNDGWWVGRIIAVKKSLCCVYFPTSREEIVYPVDKLRIHQEFYRGKWSVTNYKSWSNEKLQCC